MKIVNVVVLPTSNKYSIILVIIGNNAKPMLFPLWI